MIKRKQGQTIVEVLLVLPVFFFLVFFIMELGNIAYHSIISHHVAYELARVGALSAVTRQGGKTDKSRADGKVSAMAKQMFSASRIKAVSTRTKVESNGRDPQVKGVRYEDYVVTVTYQVRLIFPGTSWILADKPKKVGIKKIYATARMPIERPTLN